jgi:antitoxin FitA
MRRMSRVIRIRNVPASMHRKLKARAAMAGMSLSDFLLAEMRALAERPTVTELRERLRRRSSAAAGFSAADAVSRERKLE